MSLIQSKPGLCRCGAGLEATSKLQDPTVVSLLLISKLELCHSHGNMSLGNLFVLSKSKCVNIFPRKCVCLCV